MVKQLQHLKDQLFARGIEKPEEVASSRPTDLAAGNWNTISGGFGQFFFTLTFDQLHTVSPPVCG